MTLTLPPESTYSEMERSWIENEPPYLFPGDQTSLWGQARKVFADYLQENISNKLDQIYNMLDPSVADSNGITLWEIMLGIPVDTNKSLELRRAFVQSRRQRGPFTRTRRRAIVEAFIAATFGPAVAITSSGIPLEAGGVALYSGEDSLVGTYNIIEDIPNFSYEVRILDTVTVNEDGLTRELERITTAPITFTIVFTATP